MLIKNEVGGGGVRCDGMGMIGKMCLVAVREETVVRSFIVEVYHDLCDSTLVLLRCVRKII